MLVSRTGTIHLECIYPLLLGWRRPSKANQHFFNPHGVEFSRAASTILTKRIHCKYRRGDLFNTGTYNYTRNYNFIMYVLHNYLGTDFITVFAYHRLILLLSWQHDTASALVEPTLSATHLLILVRSVTVTIT